MRMSLSSLPASYSVFDAAWRARCIDGLSLVDRETAGPTGVANPPGCTSFFVRLRAVSSSRPTFQSAPGAAAVKGGAEQPGATRSALQRAWRGLRGPDLDRREHGATIVVGGNSMPIPTGLWFFPHPTSVLPHRDRRSWRGSSGARVRPCCCGASDWPAVSSADPGGAGTGRRYGW
jgi:hypothetical protein